MPPPVRAAQTLPAPAHPAAARPPRRGSEAGHGDPDERPFAEKWLPATDAWGLRLGRWVAALLSERGDLKAEVARLRERDAKAREAFGLIAWMAKEYAEAGGSGGPELRTYNDAMRLLEETP